MNTALNERDYKEGMQQWAAKIRRKNPGTSEEELVNRLVDEIEKMAGLVNSLVDEIEKMAGPVFVEPRK